MNRLVQAVIAVIVLPYFLLYWVLSLLVSDKDSLWQAFTQYLSLFPGKLGSFLRVRFMYWTATECHQETFIGFGALFSHCDTSIANGAYIGPQCNIGKCSIGTNTLLGSGVHILSGKNQHDFSDPDTPIKEQGGVFEKISIGENCWIGNGAIVMASVGDNSVIAAGAVVVNEVPAGGIVGGNPGKVIKQVGL